MGEPNKAVFLSYASQDAEAARRICEALRAAGVEVWFDQSELVGGDAWDAKIRGQIGSCALFVPLISANTQARLEGYFRIEWKLAAQRTHAMADEKAFLLPVLIDGTRDAEAKVPAEFRAVQWTRLPGGEVPAAFCDRVRSLLGRTSRGEVRPGATVAEQPARPRKRGGRAAALLVTALLLTAAGVWFWPKPAVEGRPAAVAQAPVVADKSVAVLPFENRSTEKENAFFTDGIHEDILTSLARLRELRVVSRTSVMEYRGTTKKIPQIGRELHVAYVLEGSVQRAGNKVRVTGQLIRAATDEHVWAQSYDRDLSDIFAIQSELAQAIAGELKAALSPREQQLLAQRPTENTAAYDLYLKAMQVGGGLAESRVDLKSVENLLTSAVEMDPNFGIAWCELAEIHAGLMAASVDTTPARLEKARVAVERARALIPDSPAVARAQGAYYLFAVRDPPRAREHFERLVELQPNDPDTRWKLGIVLLLQGHWKEAMETQRLATQLDPRNVSYASGLVRSLWNARRYDEALAEVGRMKAIQPGRVRFEAEAIFIQADATGAMEERNLALERLIARHFDASQANELRKIVAMSRGDVAEFARLDEAKTAWHSFSSWDEDTWGALNAASFYNNHGEPDRARQRLGNLPDKLRAQLELEPNNTQVLRSLAMAEDILGHYDEALKWLDRAAEVMPAAKDAGIAATIRSLRAQLFVHAGDYDRALPEIEWLLRTPTLFKVHWLKPGGRLAPAKPDPRFEALINDPKNNAPLF
jgi:TolB-like protein/Tfp pilus assembly protein PilF